MCCPVLVNFGAYADEDGLWVVRLSDRTVRLRLADAQGQALWHWLGRWCDGQNAMADVLAAYAEAPVANVSADAFECLLADLLEAGVLRDAAQVLTSLADMARPGSLWGRALPPSAWPKPPELMEDDRRVRWLLDTYSSPTVVPWHALVQERRSTYTFKNQPLSLPELSQLLCCYAAVGHEEKLVRRAVPSGGGLYLLKLWLLLLKPCEGWAVGVYEVVYRADGAVGLRNIGSQTADDVWQQALLACADPAALQHASAWLVVGADLAAIAKKYRNLAYSHALIEAGAVLQNMALIASAMHVGMHLRAGFDHVRMQAMCQSGDMTLLISAVMGAKEANAKASIHEPMCLKMGWAMEIRELPFHTATAHVFLDDQTSMVCSGRSRDAALAYDKALSEAMERYAMMHGPDVVMARWGELPNMVHPHAMLRWENRDFDATQRSRWIAFENLADGKKHYILEDLCFYRASDAISEASYGAVNTSGMACAPSRDMAVTLATLELVERDAFMRAWLTGGSCQPLPLKVFDEDTRAMCEHFEAQGCRVVLGLLSSAWAVVVLVFVQHEELGFTRVSTAADFDVVSAAGKAMSEVAGVVVSHLRGRTSEPVDLVDVSMPQDHGRLYCQRQYFRQADFLVAAKTLAQPVLPTSMSHDLFQRMWQAGLKIYVCDVAMPEKRAYLQGGQPWVCRVVIPGLISMVFGADFFPLPEAVLPAWRVDESPINRALVHPFS